MKKTSILCSVFALISTGAYCSEENIKSIKVKKFNDVTGSGLIACLTKKHLASGESEGDLYHFLIEYKNGESRLIPNKSSLSGKLQAALDKRKSE